MYNPTITSSDTADFTAKRYTVHDVPARVSCTDNVRQAYIDIIVNGEPVDVLNSRDYATGGRLSGWSTREKLDRWTREHLAEFLAA